MKVEALLAKDGLTWQTVLWHWEVGAEEAAKASLHLNMGLSVCPRSLRPGEQSKSSGPDR